MLEQIIYLFSHSNMAMGHLHVLEKLLKVWERYAMLGLTL